MQLYVSSLTRRVFPSGQPHNATDSLADQRRIAKEAADATKSTFIDLNQVSLTYVDAIGATDAMKFNLGPSDKTHLNPWGEIVFGRIVADLIQKQLLDLESYFKENKTLSNAISAGVLPP